MSATCLCRSVVMSVNFFFCLSVFVCELTFGQLSVGELSQNDVFDYISKVIVIVIITFLQVL